MGLEYGQIYELSKIMVQQDFIERFWFSVVSFHVFKLVLWKELVKDKKNLKELWGDR